MTESILTAQVTSVQIGTIEVEGLLLSNGEFAIAVPQLIPVFSDYLDTPNYASQTLKRTLGKEFTLLLAKTPFNRRAINVILVKDVEKLVIILAQKGVKSAIKIHNQNNPTLKMNLGTPEKQVKKKRGYIYLLEGSNILKLGYSTNIEQRIKSLSRWDGEFELIAKVQGTISKEKSIHSVLHKTGDCFGDEWYPVYRKHEILSLMDKSVLTPFEALEKL